MEPKNQASCFLIAAMSVDGYIARDEQEASTNWTSKEETKHFLKLTKQAGAVIMGRKTYATIPDKYRPLTDRINVIYTRDNSQQPQLSSTSQLEKGKAYYTNLPPAELLSQLGAKGVEQVALCGGASLYNYFWRAGVVERLLLTIEPIMFGQGIPLFGNQELPQKKLELQQVQQLSAQTMVLDYLVQQ